MKYNHNSKPCVGKDLDAQMGRKSEDTQRTLTSEIPAAGLNIMSLTLFLSSLTYIIILICYMKVLQLK